jgi:diguanylate cyclase (GGDEF)-like protein/PAS domain S-box-containing protein
MGMPAADASLVLIDDDPRHEELLREAVRSPGNDKWTVDWHRSLASGVQRLTGRSVAAIFLNLNLPDSAGLETLAGLLAVAPSTPIVVLGCEEDDGLCGSGVPAGAYDYLPEAHLDRYAFVQALRHLNERDAAQEVLFIEQERAQVTLNSIGDAVLCVDLDNRVTYLNVVAEQMTGWNRKEASGLPVSNVFRIINGATRLAAPNPLAEAMERNQTVALNPNCILIGRDGGEAAIEDSAAPIHGRDGRIIGAVIVFHDVSTARTLALEMAHLAQHDVLTNLPNRLLLHERLTRALLLAQRNQTALAVLFLDLDGFKRINDSLGHAMGDMLLQSVATRLSAGLRESDTVSRQGGDEFVILLTAITHPDDAALKAVRILAAIKAPHQVGEHQLRVSASIGLSAYPDDGLDAETLLKHADLAMYEAKKQGCDRMQRFSREMGLQAGERQALEGQLRGAIEADELILHYQPKVNLVSGQITSVEALVRWQHPRRGLLLPGQFLPIAEDSGILTDIDYWVLHEACRQTRQWLDSGIVAVPVAVNVSTVTFHSERFVERVSGVLGQTVLLARYLELELTETALMSQAGVAAAALVRIRAMGVRLALDDFGTGYSSLSYLTRFKVDTVKIDRSFVRSINTSSADTVVITAIINLARRLRHCVVAEGIETAEQLAFLRMQGCDEGQGYYFSRPVAADAIATLLRAGLPGLVPVDGDLGSGDRQKDQEFRATS